MDHGEGNNWNKYFVILLCWKWFLFEITITNNFQIIISQSHVITSWSTALLTKTSRGVSVCLYEAVRSWAIELNEVDVERLGLFLSLLAGRIFSWYCPTLNVHNLAISSWIFKINVPFFNYLTEISEYLLNIIRMHLLQFLSYVFFLINNSTKILVEIEND